MKLKASIKIISIFAGAALALAAFGCSAVKTPASKEHTPAAKTAPVKVPKNDPDHIHYIYPDGSSSSQVWTNSVR